LVEWQSMVRCAFQGCATRACSSRISCRFLAHVVAVEVDARGVHARADAAVGAKLAAEVRQVELAVVRVDAVVAVGIEQRDDDQHDRVQQVAVGAAQDVAHQRHAAFLALDLAGVDPVDHQHDRQTGSARRLRVKWPVRTAPAAASARPSGDTPKSVTCRRGSPSPAASR
jgi:hypothetical protein